MEPSFKADLNEYISQCKVRLKSILQGLNWTEAGTLKDYNSNSIASSSRHDMKKPCSTFKSTFPESCVTENSVVLETPQLQALLGTNKLKAPENFIELQVNFSREQKLKLYEHAINNTKTLENNLSDKDVDGEVSLSDILAQKKREEKRKKRKFRKSKPTHIEEVRSLVDLQMQALEQFLGNKMKVETTTQRRCSKQDDHRKEIKPSKERRRLKHYGREEQNREINIENQRRCSKQDDHGEEIKHSERRRFKEYGRKERHREMYIENHEIKNYHGKLDKEICCHKQSPNHEYSGIRNREFKSRDRERRRSVSSRDSIRQERKKHRSEREHRSKERRKRSKRSRSHSKKDSKEKEYYSNRRRRSHDRKLSKEIKSGRSSSYERKDNSANYSRKTLASDSKHLKEKYNKYKNQSSRSPESYTK